MFVQHEMGGGGPPGRPRREDPAGLTAVQRDLLWCLRRLAMVRPLGSARDVHVHLLLQRRFGEGALGLEHLLRCLIVGLGCRAVRPIRLHRPFCLGVSADEWRLLLAIGDPGRAASLLAPLAGTRGHELAGVVTGIAALLPG